MEPQVVPFFGLTRFGLPMAVSAAFLVRLWWRGDLYGTRGTIFVLWFLAASIGQALATDLPVWVVAFVAQTILAVLLVMKKQLTDV
jgi:hypothetical protein